MDRFSCVCRQRWVARIVVAALAFAVSSARAEDAVRKVQSALKSSGYFYGTPSGNLDDETHSALRRYQIHEGLPVTGELDPSTSKSLHVPVVSNAKSAAVGDQADPAARGESAGPVKESDREFVKRMEEKTPPGRVTIRPTPEPDEPPAPQRARSERAASTPRAPAPIRVATPAARPPIPEPEPQPEPAREVTRQRQRPTNLESEVSDFVTRYLSAGASPNVDAEVGMYAGLVTYFNNGPVNRKFIHLDTANYRRRWPEREYSLEEKPAIVSVSGDGQSVTVRFRIRYQVRSGSRSASGRTDTTMGLQRDADGNFEIVSVKEAHLPRS